MKNKITIATIAIIVLIGIIVFATSNKSQQAASDGHTDHSHPAATTTGNHSMQTGGPMFGAKLAGTRVVLKNASLKAGNQTLAFQLFGKDGHAFGPNDLSVMHEKKMHFIVVSDDFSEYLHLHPEFKNENWSVDLSLKDNTSYQAYVDIAPTEETPQILRVPLTVGSPQTKTKVTQNNSTLTVGKNTVSMKVEADLVSGHENNIVFTLTQNGKSITPEMYLGALGHVVALNHSNPDNFVHAHPVTHEGADSDIHFAINFPTTGIYTFFAQFQVDGKVETYPFSVTVKEGHNEPAGHTEATEPVEAHH